jgi:repressor LexA
VTDISSSDSHQAPIRPTKKQRELLLFIDGFIKENGYSPSYREIMKCLNYTSVASVALHVNNFIKRGHLKKREHSARSLDVIWSKPATTILSNEVTPSQEKWLVDKVEHAFREVEQSSEPLPQDIDNLVVLVGALKILGIIGAYQSFTTRLRQIRN